MHPVYNNTEGDIGILNLENGNYVWNANVPSHTRSMGRLYIKEAKLELKSVAPLATTLWTKDVNNPAISSRFSNFLSLAFVTYSVKKLAEYMTQTVFVNNFIYYVPVFIVAVGEPTVGPKHYYSTKVSDAGALEIYLESYSNYFVSFFKESAKELIWSSNDANDRRLSFEDTTLKDYLTSAFGTETTISNFILSDLENQNPKVVALSPDESYIFLFGKVFKVDDFNPSHVDAEDDELEIVNDLGFNTNIDHHMNFNSENLLEFFDKEGNSLHTIGDQCLKGAYSSSKTRNLKLENNGEILFELNNVKIWRKKATESDAKCIFPVSGNNRLEIGQKLIQFNKNPTNLNEITYLFNDDGNKVTIKDGNQIKVIGKDNFNGNFQTSPTLQTFDLN